MKYDFELLRADILKLGFLKMILAHSPGIKICSNE